MSQFLLWPAQLKKLMPPCNRLWSGKPKTIKTSVSKWKTAWLRWTARWKQPRKKSFCCKETIKNNIQVLSTASAPLESEDPAVVEYLEDAAATAEIKAKILAQKGLESFDISVETTDGIATLTGQVDNTAQVALAEKAAREAKGVKGVVNKLTVK